MDPDSRDPEGLLAHAGWIRRLAHGLVRDPERAEDLVQETWVAALRHPPRESSLASTRAFLARVLKNTFLQGARADRHRAVRERANARSEADGGGFDLIDEVDSQRVIVEEVLKLSEPYRTTLLLRYFREQSAADIARRLDLPAATVRSRLKRGLAELRERMDARHGGDRSAWSLGLLGWARAEPPSPAPQAGGAPTPSAVSSAIEGIVAMKSLKIAALAGVAAVAAVGIYRLDRAPAGAASAVRPAEQEQPEPAVLPDPQALEPREDERSQRASVSPPNAPDSEPQPAAVSQPLLASEVVAEFVDENGFAVVGVDFHFMRLTNSNADPEVPGSVTGVDGRASLSIPIGYEGAFAWVGWSAEGYVAGSAQAKLLTGRPVDLGRIVLQSGRAVLGRVVDPDGRGLAEAEVWARGVDIPDRDAGEIERRGPPSPEGMLGQDTQPKVRTDASGAFRIPGVAAGPARIWAHKQGMKYAYSDVIEVDAASDVFDVVILLRPLEREDRIAGKVLSAQGSPLSGQYVNYSFQSETRGVTAGLTTGEDGTFELVLWERVPHTFHVDGTPEQGGSAHAGRVEPGTLDLVLQLGEEETVELAVTDPEGVPIEEYRIHVFVGTDSSWTGNTEKETSHPAGRASVGLPAARFWIEVDAVGYALGKLGPFEREAVPAQLQLTLEPMPGISGRVLAGGKPVARARVHLYKAVNPGARHVVNGFPALYQATSSYTRTDAEGAFLLMPREQGEFVVRAELTGWCPTESAPIRYSAGGGGEVEIHMGRGGTLVVEVVASPGEENAGVIVAVNRGDGHPRTQRADSEGRAVFEGLTPGRYDVQRTDVEIKPFSTTSASFSGDDDQPFELDWKIEVREGGTASYALVLGE